MTALIVAAGILSVGLDAGAYLAEEASLRRSMLGTAEASISLRPVSILDVSMGYGIASSRDRFAGLDFRTTYHRFPMRVGFLLPLGSGGVGMGVGPALIGTTTRIGGSSEEEIRSGWSWALCISTRGEIGIMETAGGRMLARVALDVYQRGGRTDVSMMAGLSFSLLPRETGR